MDSNLVCDFNAGELKPAVKETLDYISKFCGVDVFLLGPKLTRMVDGMSGDAEVRMDQRLRVAIYGDPLSSEHAKARVLIHIDTLVCLAMVALNCIEVPLALIMISLAASWMLRNLNYPSINWFVVVRGRTLSSSNPRLAPLSTFRQCSRKCIDFAPRSKPT